MSSQFSTVFLKMTISGRYDDANFIDNLEKNGIHDVDSYTEIMKKRIEEYEESGNLLDAFHATMRFLKELSRIESLMIEAQA